MGDPAPPTGGDLAPLLAELRSLKKRVADLESPSGTQRGQVLRDLVGRVGYAVDGTGTTATWAALQPNNTPWGPTLSITLEETRVVSIQFALRGEAYGAATATTTNVIVAMRGMLFVNDAGVGGARGEVGVSIPSGTYSAFRSDYSIGTLICRALVTLPPGTHIVQGGFAFRNVEILGGSGNGTLTASDPNIFVDVLQTTA